MKVYLKEELFKFFSIFKGNVELTSSDESYFLRWARTLQTVVWVWKWSSKSLVLYTCYKHYSYMVILWEIYVALCFGLKINKEE